MTPFISIMAVAIIVIGILLLVIIVLTNKPRQRLDQAKYQARWMTITGGLDDNQASQQLTIMQADKLLDMALKERGAAGKTLGERMKSSKDLFSNRDAIWQAHKLRNHIAHDDNVRMNNRETSKALDAFRQALTDIGAL